jgi:phosphodiesterase/alkaline phosphatase D-like protein
MPRSSLLLHLTLVALAAGTLAACDDSGPRSPEGGRPFLVETPVRGVTASFPDGVASGDVTATSAVLWTRAEGGDMVSVEMAVADGGETSAFETAANIDTSSSIDYVVKTLIPGLEPARRYAYRFRAGDGASPTGYFVTAPAADTPAPLRFVFSGDSDGTRRADGSAPFGEFAVLDAAAAESPDFFLYFGDTIYADRDPFATTLDGYRGKYRENRGYRALREIFAQTSTYNAWDDHEVVNDFAGTTVDPAMFAAGRQAFREYMPIDDTGDAAEMYRSFRWGSDAELIILDGRSFRDASAAANCTADGAQPDPIPALAAPETPPDVRGLRAFTGLPAELPAGCLDAMNDPSRTMLGGAQEAWLKEQLTSSTATWKFVVNPVPMQALLALPYDRWEGYAAERRELLEFIRENDVRNVVFLTTDFHASVFGPVRIDAFDLASAVAYEAIAGPIATTPLQQDVVDAIGEQGAGVLGAFFSGVVKVDCAQLNSYAYALVEVDGARLTITAKDDAGSVLCEKTLEAT